MTQDEFDKKMEPILNGTATIKEAFEILQQGGADYLEVCPSNDEKAPSLIFIAPNNRDAYLVALEAASLALHPTTKPNAPTTSSKH